MSKNAQGFEIMSMETEHKFGQNIKGAVVFEYKGYDIHLSTAGVFLVDILVIKDNEEHVVRGSVEDAIKKVDELTK